MADNIAYTEGSGRTIATDEVGGVDYQLIKLVNATADSTTRTGVAANPLVVAGPTGGTSTLANVSGSASSVTLIASNANRRSAVIVNDSTAILMVKEGATASATSYTYLLQAYDTLILDGSYSGTVDGIWVSATGNARVTERT